MEFVLVSFHLQIPAFTPIDDAVYLAGDFNNWQPNQPEYQFQRQTNGLWLLEVPVPNTGIQFKITRGSWNKAELGADNMEMPNRHFIPTVRELRITVKAWSDMTTMICKHTYSDNVILLHPSFPIASLGRTRRIWAYLPPNYHTTDEKYPVIYMQDGQNLFDACSSFSGEWAVDKALNELFMDGNNPMDTCIVIGVENGGAHRTSEYSPWKHPEHGGGEGDAYLSFLCEALKPYVDGVLRTRPERISTGIIGSSMGGLISLYAALTRPDIFGMAGIFSPSLWFSASVTQLAKAPRKGDLPKLLLMAGQRESETMVSDMLELYEDLLASGYPEILLHYDLHSDGEHAEWFWKREFQHAIQWLLSNRANHEDDHIHNGLFDYQIEADDKTIIINTLKNLDASTLEIRDYCHGRDYKHALKADEPNRISYKEWENCIYSVRIITEGDLVFSRRIELV